jgi:hypothetical protein
MDIEITTYPSGRMGVTDCSTERAAKKRMPWAGIFLRVSRGCHVGFETRAVMTEWREAAKAAKNA